MDEAHQKLTAQEILVETRANARDEMNLAEFPIAILSDRSPKGVKTVEFATSHGTLVITGSDDRGLPTALDADIIIALIQITKSRNNFTDRKVNFTRYEVLRILGWPDKAEYYRRVDESLERWVGVTLRYDKAWWDNEIKTRVNASFHIIESVFNIDKTVRDELRARGQRSLPLSHFTWSEVFLKSCQANNLKQLDLSTYLAFGSSITKQMYRLLDKRFYNRSILVFNLEEFAKGHIGLSSNYSAAKIKEKLQPSIDELEAIGFIEKASREERYTKVSHGKWTIAFTQAKREEAEDARPAASEAVNTIAMELIQRGVTPSRAVKLVKRFDASRITMRIEAFDWLKKKGEKIEKPGGFLADSIVGEYALPPGFETKADREKREAMTAEKARQAEEMKLRMAAKERAAEEAEEARINGYLASLSASEREKLEADALALATSFFIEKLRDPNTSPSIAATYKRIVLANHVNQLLESNAAAKAR